MRLPLARSRLGSPATPLGPPAFPNAATTGYADGTTLTVASLDGGEGGIYYASSEGQIIEGLDIRGTLLVHNKNITIRNCKIRQIYAEHFADVDPENLIIEDNDIVGGDTSSGITLWNAHGSTVRRNDISGMENGVWLQSHGCLIEDNYIHDLASGGGDPHFDGVQIPTDGGAYDTIVRHNNFDVNECHTPGGTITASSCMTAPNAPNILIDRNRLNGGSYSLYIDGTTTGVISNNVFGAHAFGQYTGDALANVTFINNSTE